jgi:hypothetical protein
MMARVTQVYSIDEVARRIGESLELLEIISWNDDNIDYGEMIRVHNGTDESIVTFTTRGMESVQEFLAEVRTWDGGIRQFLIDEQCEPETIEAIMAHQKNA